MDEKPGVSKETSKSRKKKTKEVLARSISAETIDLGKWREFSQKSHAHTTSREVM